MTTHQSTEEERRIRYDRQVRLWGSGVQQRLHSTILIVSPGSPYIADEALKNLVLAGIGKVRIISREENENAKDSSSSSSTTINDERKKFYKQSVVALSAATTGSQEDSTSTNHQQVPTKAEALVNGLSKLNNLVDCKIFDSKNNDAQSDLYEEGKKSEYCVIAIIDSTTSEAVQKWRSVIEKVTPIDIICNIRLLTNKYAFCDFSKMMKKDSDDADVPPSSTNNNGTLDNSSYLDSPWTPKAPHPLMAALLKKTLDSLNKSSSSISSFEDLVLTLQDDEYSSEAFFHAESEVVEKVAAECLVNNSSQQEGDYSSSCSCTLNAVLGAVLSQQILTHACQVPPSVKQESNNAAGAQPHPMRWLFCTENPHVECLSGN